MTVIKKGDKVKVEYTGSLEDGTVFDSSKNHDAPLEFVVGSGQLIKGFDDAVIGMKVGDEKEISLPPEEAYGQHNPEFVISLGPSQFPKLIVVVSPLTAENDTSSVVLTHQSESNISLIL